MAIQAQMYPGFVLGGCQDLLMDNACGLNNLCFIQKPQQEHDLMHRIPFDHHPTFSQSFENQRTEIDLLINSQNERLRMALLEQRKKEISAFMKKYESKIECLMREKDEEIGKAANRNMELQNYLRRMEIESQTWQRSAIENEAMVASLNNTIQRLREYVSNAAAAAEDAESCCCLEEEEEEERESGRERWDQESRKMVCRCCNSRNSCIIMLPCRHLCSCKYCEPFLDACPLCQTLKKATLEALL